MRKLRLFFLYWGPVLVWMSLIFSASTDQGSFKHSSRILGPLLHWLFPGMTDDTVYAIIFGIRKCAHLSEYAVLFLLVWRARRKPRWHDPRPWQWTEAVEALWVTVLYAATDEFHQTFVPSREGCVRDVLIDSCGAMIAMFLLCMVGGWLSRRRERKAAGVASGT